MWKFTGSKRPDFAIKPAPGQESVWDYPRPPCIAPDHRIVEVKAGNVLIARTTAAIRILETASPPTFYIPAGDVDIAMLVRIAGRSVCEWKGAAEYWALASDGAQRAIGWSYPDPVAAFAAIANALSFYPGRVACTVDGERVRSQEGGFYGGWVTDEIVGPAKGAPGTGNW